MRAFVYARFSSDNQREESIDAQLRAVREYCDKNQIEILREYTDEARSATSDKRPGFQQMFADLSVYKPDLVIVHKLDRFSRDRYDSAYYRRVLKKNGAKLVSVLEPLDDSPESVILESVLEGMAEYYSRNLARETLKGLKETAYKCHHTGGRPPLGYDVGEDGRYIINASESEIVRKIFRLYVSGASYDRILAELDGEHTKAGKPFGKNSMNSILNNEKYRGVFTFGRQKKSDHNSHKSQPDIIRIEGGIPRIIDEGMWLAAQERLRSAKRNGQYKAKRVYLLSGKIECQKCHGTMVGATTISKKGYEHSYYGCNNRQRTKKCDQPNIPAERIENAVLDMIAERLAPDEAMVNAVLDILSEPDPNVKEYIKQLEDVTNRTARLLVAIEEGGNIPLITERLVQLTEKERALREKIAEAQKDDIDIRQVRAFLEETADIRKMPRERQREIINKVVDKIKVSENQLEVSFRIPKVAGEGNASYRKFTLQTLLYPRG